MFYIRPSIDPDALTYAQTWGATDISAISYWAKGLKNKNYWSEILSWMLRSQHGPASGTTVPSFGGYGIRNGTLVGTPAWTSEGFVFTTGLEAIIFSSPYGSTGTGVTSAITLATVFKCGESYTNALRLLIGQDWNASPNRGGCLVTGYANIYLRDFLHSPNGTDKLVDNYLAGGGLDATSRDFLAGSWSTGISEVTVNERLGTRTTDCGLYNITPNPWGIGRTYGIDATKGTYSLGVMLPYRALSSSDLQFIRGLYKDTIGFGLTGLP